MQSHPASRVPRAPLIPRSWMRHPLFPLNPVTSCAGEGWEGEKTVGEGEGGGGEEGSSHRHLSVIRLSVEWGVLSGNTSEATDYSGVTGHVFLEVGAAWRCLLRAPAAFSDWMFHSRRPDIPKAALRLGDPLRGGRGWSFCPLCDSTGDVEVQPKYVFAWNKRLRPRKSLMHNLLRNLYLLSFVFTPTLKTVCLLCTYDSHTGVLHEWGLLVTCQYRNRVERMASLYWF